MKTEMLEHLIETVLYEGYVLYPYRPSSMKNRRERFTFGRVYPEAYSQYQMGLEPCLIQTQALLAPATNDRLMVEVRFLHPMAREVGWSCAANACVEQADLIPEFQSLPELSINGRRYQAWHEAVERRIEIPPLNLSEVSVRHTITFAFSGSRSIEPIPHESDATGPCYLRWQEPIEGAVDILVEPCPKGLVKVTVGVRNLTPLRQSELGDPTSILMRLFASTHTVLRSERGAFISLMDPPQDARDLVASFRNIGTWPVLVGDEAIAQRDTLLSSPIILYDYPKVAAESRGDFFDGTEIDEMLSLRVLTMTDEEKKEMRQADRWARRILDRTERLAPEDLMSLHGRLRDQKQTEEWFNPPRRVESVTVQGRNITVGDRVRIRPRRRADVMDLVLAGRVAVVEALEQDAENHVHLALVLEEDPGQDLGWARQPGHRFFFSSDEIEPIKEESA